MATSMEQKASSSERQQYRRCGDELVKAAMRSTGRWRDYQGSDNDERAVTRFGGEDEIGGIEREERDRGGEERGLFGKRGVYL